MPAEMQPVTPLIKWVLGRSVPRQYG